MALSRLLKSWATPPASRPTASIFWAWRSCSCDCRSASSARFRPLMSTYMATRPDGAARASCSGAVEMLTSIRVPSFRRRTVSRPVKDSPCPAPGCGTRRTPPASSGGTQGRRRPTASSAVQPKTVSAARFQVITSPPGASADDRQRRSFDHRLELVARRAHQLLGCRARSRRAGCPRSRSGGRPRPRRAGC